jgi:hypothetical protein
MKQHKRQYERLGGPNDNNNVLSIRLRPGQRQALVRRAQREGLSLSALVRLALTHFGS